MDRLSFRSLPSPRALMRVLLLCALVVSASVSVAAPAPEPASAASPAIRIAQGSGSFVFEDEKGDASKHMTVFTYLPAGLDAKTARIVFVMHGHSKDADVYRDTWIAAADKYKLLIVAPLFDSQQWGGGQYSYASVVTRGGQVHDAALWSFNVIEHLFDAIEAATGNQSPRYFIYGHSEGGQFVHRFVLLLPDARYETAVAANPGWYTMPRFDIAYPFGLGSSPATEASLKTSLGRRLIVMLGDRDTDPNHKELNKTPRAMAQGANRFDRGHTFFETAQSSAAALGVALGWQLRIVPGAAHENSKMSRAAADVLMGP